VRGKVVICASSIVSQLAPLSVASKNVVNAGGSGLIYAQYTKDNTDSTAECGGIACVLVDMTSIYQIDKYMGDAR